MPVNDMVLEGFALLAIGMGIVFGFLLLLVGAMNLMARLVRRFAGEPAPIALAGDTAGVAMDESAVVAVIAAAVALYRSRHAGQGG